MKINYDRIHRAQELMKQEGMIGIMIMNHDDYRYFFGDTRSQPRAIIPAGGEPVFISFRSEEPELKAALKSENVKVFSHVGEQMSDVKKTFQEIFNGPPPGMQHPEQGKAKVGMQMWFHTPAFLVDLFRTINKQVELVSSDPVMDALRMVKEPDEIEALRKSQSIAAKGMETIRELIKSGITGHELATEAMYVMMKNGAEGTSTPIHINSGIRSCWVHGKVDHNKIEQGDLVVVDLTPEYKGYCANLARTFVVGEPTEQQEKLYQTYLQMKEGVRKILKPGIRSLDLDKASREVCEENGFGEYHLNGISHGIGLRFEETPAATIIPPHRIIRLKENMTVTIGHTILAIPGLYGVRFEDVYRITPLGGEILYDYPIEFVIG